MNKDKNNFFSARANARETLRKYDKSKRKRKNKTRTKPPQTNTGRSVRADKSVSAKPRKQTPPANQQRRRKHSALRGIGAIIAGIFMLLRGKVLAFLAVCLVVMGIGAAVVWFLGMNNALEVFINGEPVGFMAERDILAEDLTAQVLTAISVIEDGAGIHIDQEITVAPGRTQSSEYILARPDIVRILLESVTYRIEGFSISVDGIDMGALRTREAAEGLLQNFTLLHVPPDAELVRAAEFDQDVTIHSRPKYANEFDTAEMVFARMGQTRQGSQRYTVVEGDSVSVIASRFGMTQDEVFDANPDISRDNPSLRIGQVVNITYTAPLISVRTIERSTETVDIPYGIDSIENPARASTFRNTIQQGQAGIKELTSYITRVNGVIIDTEVVSESILQAPVDEVIEVGTRGASS